MSILNEQVQFPTNSSLIVKKKNDPHFTFPIHYHKEFELVYVEQGYGLRFTGGKVESFTNGDMVLLAPYLPHCWESDKAFYKNDPNLKVKGIVVQIPNDFFKTVISSYPEFSGIKQLLDNSNQGLKVLGESRVIAVNMLNDLFALKGIKRLFHFLDILNMIHDKGEYELLNQSFSNEKLRKNSRLGKVFDYLHENYFNTIYLEDLCQITGLTTTGFSLWFKRNTAKTFSGFLHEYRIGRACELLRDPLNQELKITEICFMVGFDNLSNFNRVFKKITDQTPREYKRLFNKADMSQESNLVISKS